MHGRRCHPRAGSRLNSPAQLEKASGRPAPAHFDAQNPNPAAPNASVPASTKLSQQYAEVTHSLYNQIYITATDSLGYIAGSAARPGAFGVAIP